MTTPNLDLCYHTEAVVLLESLSDPSRTLLGMTLTLDEEDFLRPCHRATFVEIRRRLEAGIYGGIVGMGGFFKQLHARYGSEVVEMLDFIDICVTHKPCDAKDHEGRLRQLRAQRRRLEAMERTKASNELLEQIPVSMVRDELSDLGQDITELATDLADIGVMARGEDAFNEALSQATHTDERGVVRIYTGVEAIDNITGGIDRGRLVVVGARPSVGKTAFAKTVIHRALHDGRSVLMGVGEGTRHDIAKGLLAIESGVALGRIMRGTMTDTERRLVVEATKVMGSKRIEFNDSAVLTPKSIAARARSIKQAEGLDLVVVDYLQRLALPPAETRERQVAIASKLFVDLAKELDCVVMLLCQLNRQLAQREDKLPKMTDLRESGSIEQDADLIVFLHRPAAIQDSGADASEAFFRVAKQRYGPIGDGNMRFIPQTTRFADAARPSPPPEAPSKRHAWSGNR